MVQNSKKEILKLISKGEVVRMIDNIGTPKSIKKTMRKHNISPKKSLGQNFLIDSNILDKIVAAGELSKADHVVEIGPGLGSLTQKLASLVGKLTVIEKDRQLIPVLQEVLYHYANISYIDGDVLKIDWNDLIETDSRIKVIANLPYYITTPIIMGFFEKNVPVDLMVFMVQREVAERMVAKPGGKDYGSLSIAVQFYSKPEIVTIVPPTVFIPRPNVDSAVIKLSRLQKPAVNTLSPDLFFKVVRAAFQKRRKVLRNSLSTSGEIPLSKEKAIEALKNAAIDPQLRGERLSLEDFARLSDQIYLICQEDSFL